MAKEQQRNIKEGFFHSFGVLSAGGTSKEKESIKRGSQLDSAETMNDKKIQK